MSLRAVTMGLALGASARRWIGLLLLGFSGGVGAEILPEPTVSEYEPAEVRAELERLGAVGDGIIVTLAACDEEPHCVTALSAHELARLIDRIQLRIDHLQSVRREEGLADPYDRFLRRYIALRDRYTEYLQQVERVSARINVEELEQDWEDLLDFSVVEPEPDPGPQVPSPNDQLTLDQFEDAHEPMPIE